MCFRCELSVRLGHLDQHRMQRLTPHDLLSNIRHVDLSTYVSCLAKISTWKRFLKAPRVEFLLQLVPYDVCGLLNVTVRHGARNTSLHL